MTNGYGESLDCINNEFDDSTYAGLPPGPFYTSPKVLEERERVLRLLREAGKLPTDSPPLPTPPTE